MPMDATLVLEAALLSTPQPLTVAALRTLFDGALDSADIEQRLQHLQAQREQAMRQHRTRAEDLAEDRILDVLLPPARNADGSNAPATDGAARQGFRKKLREGELDDKEIEIEVAGPSMQAEIFAPPEIGRAHV